MDKRSPRSRRETLFILAAGLVGGAARRPGDDVVSQPGQPLVPARLAARWGHDAFLLEVETMTGLMSTFLDRIVNEFGIGS